MSKASLALTANRSREGIASLIIAVFFFSFQDMIIKYLSTDYSILQLLFIRSSISLILLSGIAYKLFGRKVFISKQPRLVLIRSVLIVLCIVPYYLAIPVLPLADIVGIVFSSPVIITLLSVLILKEKVKLSFWVAVVVGFVGVLIIANPTGNLSKAGVMLAFGSAIAYAVMSIVTRKINLGDQPITIAIYSMAFYVVFSLISLILITVNGIKTGRHPSLDFLVRDWIIPAQHELVLLICLGLVGTVGFYYLARAYMIAPASHVAPFEYVYIIFVVVLSYVFFSEIPKTTTFLGVSILILSGLYIWRHDKYR